MPGMEKKPRVTPVNGALAVLLALASGCMVFLSFPDFDLFPLEWFAFVPLLVAIRGRGFKGGFLLGLVAGWATNAGGFYWIGHVLMDFGHMGPGPAAALTAAATLYQGLSTAAAAGMAAAAASRWSGKAVFVAFPVFYTAFEHVIPLLFPWYLANGQERFTAVIQVVELTGVAGLTFLILVVNCALAAVVDTRIDREPFPFVRVSIAGFLLVGVLLYGAERIREVDEIAAKAPALRVAIVEADVGIWEKQARGEDGKSLPWREQVNLLYENLLKHQLLTAEAERESRPDLVVWSESSYVPLYEVYHRSTEAFAVATGPGPVLDWITSDGPVPARGQGADTLGSSGVFAAAAASEKLILAVGPGGAAYLFDGDVWRREVTGTDRDLLAVGADPDTKTFMAVGVQGTALFRDARGEWSAVETGAAVDLESVTPYGAGRFAACGDGGMVLTFQDGSARRIASGTTEDLNSVSWSQGYGLWAAGNRGTLLRVDGSRVTRLDPGTTLDLLGVAAGAGTWVVGERGLLLGCKVDGCTRIESPVSETLVSVAGDGAGRAWAVGAGGSILELGPNGAAKLGNGTRRKGSYGHIAWIPFTEGYPFPRDVKRIYTSPLPLPAGNARNPEVALRADRGTPVRDRNAAIRGFSTPLFMGVITQEGGAGKVAKRYYNTAVLVDPDGRVLGKYDKNYLLLFGEYLPFSDWFPFLKKWFPEAGNYEPGQEPEVFTLGRARLGPLICYEDIIPSFTRSLVGKGPNVLVNITNDAWFGRTSEPWEHLQLAAFRSVENRRYLVRATNTGVSAFVDPVGRIIEPTSLDDPEVIVHDVALLDVQTPYTRWGDVFAWVCVLLTLSAGLVLRYSKSN